MRQTRPEDAPPIRIEPDTGWAWRGDDRLELTPKAFAVLRHLIEHPEHLITKDELLAAAWGDTVVSDAALTSCIRDLRRALDDSSRAPRYIETVHRRGFRFIGPVGPPARAPRSGPESVSAAPPTLVGRDAELARLHALFGTAVGGDRRLVFVTGEAGIGKTTLVEAFLAQLGDANGLRIGRGQCVEQYGASEAYLPVLEALGRLGREPRGDALVRILRQYAPTWLAQLPALLTDDEVEAVQRRVQGTTRERMLRELIEALDVVSMEAPLVLLLEDLHWSDAATIDLIAMLARRRDRARLLIVATYRPADLAAGPHPLGSAKQELQVHGHCEEVALDFLSEAAVGAYIAGRFPHATFPPALARVLHENTGGNPLFLVNVVDDLVTRGDVRDVGGRWTLAVPVDRIASDVPRTLWQMVEKQIERLTPDEQAILALGSVAGAEFSAALSAVDGIEAHTGEQCCETLARRGQFLRPMGVAAWPDGTVAGCYGFIHALYRNVLYARVSIGRRVGLHLRIGMRLERAHGPHAAHVAGELAMHFEQGRDFERAVHYRRQAAEGALRQHGYREAVIHATQALELLAALPESPERNQQELMVQTILGAAVIATNGWAAPEVARAYARARELCTETRVTPQLLPVLVGLSGFYLMRGELRTAREVAEQLLALTDGASDPAILVAAHNMVGLGLFYGGQFVEALAHFERAWELYDPEQSFTRLRALSVDHDSGVSCAAHTAMTLMILGYQDRAAQRMRDCLGHARSIDHPLSVAMAYNFAATFHQCRREAHIVQELEDVRLEYSRKHDFELFLLLGEIYRGWLLAEQGQREEGAARIHQGLAVYQAIGAELGRPTFLGILAEVCDALDHGEEARAAVAEALDSGEETGLHYWDAELHRLRGTLVLRAATEAERVGAGQQAEACFLEALEIARRQNAKFFELRAAVSLSRLWQQQGRSRDAHALLSDVYGWFTEGFDNGDLTDAKTLLGQLETSG
jgi:DNA-binding winged helix-turn-helix (wHTH) protein/predicted ATPase